MAKIPEIVEVQIQVEGLRETILKDTFKEIIFEDRGEKIIRPFEKKDFRTLLTGRRIDEVSRIGKYIIFKLDNNLQVATHLRMTGRFTVDVSEDTVSHTRIRFKMKSGKELRYSDVRIFGRIVVVDDVSALEKGLDALESPEEDILKELKRGAKKYPNKNVKEFLMSQKVISGLGNVYVNEILFRSGLFPGKLISELTNQQYKKLAHTIKTILRWSYDHGGLSLKDYFHVDGSQGRTQRHLNVYQNERCQKCLAKVYKSDKFDTRSTYYCYNCQPK